MKNQSTILVFLAGLILGGALLWTFAPAAESSSGLVDGKYLVVEGEDGHFIYEKGEDGFQVAVKEITPKGLRAIWELQASFMPHTVQVGQENVLSVPATLYSTETRAFQVLHRFYRIVDDKLIEIPMEGAAKPAK